MDSHVDPRKDPLVSAAGAPTGGILAGRTAGEGTNTVRDINSNIL